MIGLQTDLGGDTATLDVALDSTDYSLAFQAHATGRRLARPLLFDFPDDPAVADLWDEFLLGHDLLFAPLWHVGDRSRSVYLPAGTWIDYWQPGNRLFGPTTVTVDAPIDRIPVFVRAGGILPLEVDSGVTGNGSHDLSHGRLTIDAYPAGTSMLTLHEDDTATTFTLTEANCGDAPCVRLDISPSQRGYVIRLLTDQPRQVSFASAVLPNVGSLAALEAAESGWFYDQSVGRLWAKVMTNGGLAATLLVTR